MNKPGSFCEKQGTSKTLISGNGRLCQYCKRPTLIMEKGFSWKGVAYDMPYCMACNTIFAYDVERIMQAIRSLDCQKI